jgi:hypothetical protein
MGVEIILRNFGAMRIIGGYVVRSKRSEIERLTVDLSQQTQRKKSGKPKTRPVHRAVRSQASLKVTGQCLNIYGQI